MGNLANEIYKALSDMDFADYGETYTQDIKDLMEDLKLLEINSTGALFNAIKMMVGMM